MWLNLKGNHLYSVPLMLSECNLTKTTNWDVTWDWLQCYIIKDVIQLHEAEYLHLMYILSIIAAPNCSSLKTFKTLKNYFLNKTYCL